MKFDALYLDFDQVEFKNKMDMKWSELLDKVCVCGDIGDGQTKSLEMLQKELIEQRNRITETISEIEAILESDKKHKEEIIVINFAENYKDLINKTFNWIGEEIFSFAYNICFSRERNEADISSNDIYTLVSYRISRSIKETFDLYIKENQPDLEKRDLKCCMLIPEDENIFYLNLLNEYNKLYEMVFDQNKIDLSLLISETENQDSFTSEYRSRLQSQLFRSILSRYIFTWRSRNNVTQNELSKKSGVDRTMIAKIEKLQQTASLDTTIKLLSTINAKLIIVPERRK